MSDFSPLAIESELYLQGVLSAMEELPTVSEEVRKQIEKEDFTLKVSILGGSSLYLTFIKGTIIAERSGISQVGLCFLSHQQFLNSVLKSGFNIPIPTHGLLYISKLLLFQKLGDAMQPFLEPKSYDLLDPVFLEKHVRLTMHVALHATQRLVEIDSEAKAWLANQTKKCIQFSVGNTSIKYWIDISPTGIVIHKTMPVHSPDAQVLFQDPQIAYEALNNKIVPWAALGLGQIQVRGDVLLADQFSMVMEKVSNYIKPRF
jgi:hypothetical protein